MIAKATWRLSLVLASVLAGGCAGTGVIENLPDPMFQEPRRPRRAPVRPPVVKVPPRIAPPVAPPPRPQPRTIGTVMLDAGHGGHDPGALGVGPLPEKDVNLAVSQALGRSLGARGVRVITTRDADRFLELDDRAALAERRAVDLFVSIHADAAQRSGASGMTIYIARGARNESVRAAASVEAAIKRAGLKCRGVRGAGFRVLVGHSRPAMLIECGFLTNPGEARRLATPAYQGQIAAAIADGIVNHLTR